MNHDSEGTLVLETTTGNDTMSQNASLETTVDVSVIVPTYNESENILDLISRVEEGLNGYDFEILVVDDDSPDGTWRKVEDRMRAGGKDSRVRLLRRTRNKGLSAAVVDGFAQARGRHLGVLDADLSHDTRILSRLVDALHDGADMAVGSRRVPGGGADKWPWHRRLFSGMATGVSKVLLGFRIHDPMSGYFFVKRELFENCRLRLRPKGYKILLEILLKSGVRDAVEIPYIFKDRKQGYSKLSSKVMVNYFTQVMELFVDKKVQALRRFWHRSRYKKVAGLLERGTLLDLGCGQPCESMPDGSFLRYVKRGFGADLKPLRGPLPFVRADIAFLPFKTGSLDNVTAMEVLEHVPDPDAALAEIRRVLKDGGAFVMSVPRETWLWNKLWAVWERTFGKLWRETHLGEVEHDAWPALIRKHFKLDAITSNLHYVMIFRGRK